MEAEGELLLQRLLVLGLRTSHLGIVAVRLRVEHSRTTEEVVHMLVKFEQLALSISGMSKHKSVAREKEVQTPFAEVELL